MQGISVTDQVFDGLCILLLALVMIQWLSGDTTRMDAISTKTGTPFAFFFSWEPSTTDSVQLLTIETFSCLFNINIFNRQCMLLLYSISIKTSRLLKVLFLIHHIHRRLLLSINRYPTWSFCYKYIHTYWFGSRKEILDHKCLWW